jgi:hypothetical protein
MQEYIPLVLAEHMRKPLERTPEAEQAYFEAYCPPPWTRIAAVLAGLKTSMRGRSTRERRRAARQQSITQIHGA